MIAIIDYGMGNLGSIANMLKKIGAEARITHDPAVIERAEKLILPGVGAFDHGMQALEARGLIPVLNQRVLVERAPMLGLCLGMQLFTQRSEEGQLPGLGWIKGETVRFKFDALSPQPKIPHMGWNTLRVCRPHPIFADTPENELEPRFYFVHSYHVRCAEAGVVLGETHYGYAFASAVAQGNIAGVQFHPEKSHKFGMRLLKNFAEAASIG